MSRLSITIVTLMLWACSSLALACNVREPTRATGAGPHYHYDGEGTNDTKLWRQGDPGEPLFLRGRVVDTCGKPIVGARIQLWHADRNGTHSDNRWHANFVVGDKADFRLSTVFPGYAGGLPRHIHVVLTHPDYSMLVTRLFFRDDESLHSSDQDLALLLEAVTHAGLKGWTTGFEFVMSKP